MRSSWDSKKVRARKEVLVQHLPDDVAVLLHLGTEQYYSLDGTATTMWRVLDGSPTIEAAARHLLEIFEVEEDRLRRDLDGFLDELLRRRLVEVLPSDDVGSP